MGFEIIKNRVVTKKALPLDIEFAQALESTLSEWSSKEDDEAYEQEKNENIIKKIFVAREGNKMGHEPIQALKEEGRR